MVIDFGMNDLWLKPIYLFSGVIVEWIIRVATHIYAMHTYGCIYQPY